MDLNNQLQFGTDNRYIHYDESNCGVLSLKVANAWYNILHQNDQLVNCLNDQVNFVVISVLNI